MRFFSILTLSACLSAPAFAADLGTYRPGSPYNSVVAQGADVCENQCAGDAQCRGWNYVKVNPRAPGVCEFNSRAANPIESSISISGDGASGLSSKISVGSTNTIRVGTSSAPKPRSVATQSSPSRRVVREAIPQRFNPSQAVARFPADLGSLTAQQNQYRQATGHLGAGYVGHQQQQALRRQQQQAIRQQQANFQRQQAIRQQQQYANATLANRSGQRLLNDPRIQQQRLGQSAHIQHNLDGVANGRPPIGVPIESAVAPYQQQAPLSGANSSVSATPRGSVNNPVTHRNAQQRIRQAEIEAAQQAAYAQAQRQAQLQALSVEQAQQSLFGNLNDDVKVPFALTELPSDVDAPIPTAQSRPSTPIAQELLGTLAGAPHR